MTDKKDAPKPEETKEAPKAEEAKAEAPKEEAKTEAPAAEEVMDKKQGDFYKKLRKKVADWLESKGTKEEHAQYVMLAPDFFHLMCCLMQDDRVAVNEKLKLGGALAYFIMPIDLMPEAFMGPIGFLDDIALSAYVLNSVMKETPAEVIEGYWAGEGDILKQIREVIEKSDELVGSGLFNKVKDKFDEMMEKKTAAAKVEDEAKPEEAKEDAPATAEAKPETASDEGVEKAKEEPKEDKAKEKKAEKKDDAKK